MAGYTYILADMRRGRTYVGVTNNLVARVYQHRKRLVYFEEHGRIEDAIQRETSLKRWYRRWKEALIEESNPEWRDLWDDIVK